ncbi:MAG: hypothetical protein Q7R67_00545 [bacterium]|nr:hypothetical protein [bacterium]
MIVVILQQFTAIIYDMNPDEKKVVFETDQQYAPQEFMAQRTGTSLMSRVVMNFSGGIVSTDKQAQIALAILAVVILTVSAVMFLRATERPVPISTNIIEVAVPRN